MTLVESIRALLVNAGIESAYIIDAPESTLDAGAVVIIPYSSDSEEYLPVGTQYLQVRASAATFPAAGRIGPPLSERHRRASGALLPGQGRRAVHS